MVKSKTKNTFNKINIANKIAIIEKYNLINNYCAVARDFNVSEAAIRYIIKHQNNFLQNKNLNSKSSKNSPFIIMEEKLVSILKFCRSKNLMLNSKNYCSFLNLIKRFFNKTIGNKNSK